MAESSREISKESTDFLSLDKLNALLKWLRPLQKSLSIEVERGFQNVLGREERFNSFMSRELASPPEIIKFVCDSTKTEELSSGFSTYDQRVQSSRRRLVTETRQFLQRINCRTSDLLKTKSRSLRLESTYFKEEPKSSDQFPVTLGTPLINVKGIGPKYYERLAVLGIFKVNDIFSYYPRDYIDYSSLLSISELKPGLSVTLIASIQRCNIFRSPRNQNLVILELYIKDITGKLKISRFFAGRRFTQQSYLAKQRTLYKPGTTIAVSGSVRKGPYGTTIHDPLIEVMDGVNSKIKSKTIGRLVPIYPLTDGISPQKFRDILSLLLPCSNQVQDPLPLSILDKLSLPSKPNAIKAIHKPFSSKSLEIARKRLVFEEFFMMQLGLLRRRVQLRTQASPILSFSGNRDGLVGTFLGQLPFELTRAQQRVLNQIEADLLKAEPMSRLVQGDVGSGKTVVAIAALLNAVQSGWQGAFMAPTEVLASQHYRTLCKWLPQLHVNVEFLTGSTTRTKRRQVLDDLSSGAVNLLVGTHALIEDPVSFFRLGLVVVDEQHRFGVHQRNRLLQKGMQPHLLTMTATPIPRTLALSLHGDLDVSQIDELPPGRSPISTTVLVGSNRSKAYDVIRQEVNKGQQAYFVLPLIEESENLNLRSAINVHKQLNEDIFPDFTVGLLHGRMNSSEKNVVIEKFLQGICQVLVSTTVVEVGVDVPGATVMVIDHADRFGLAQLHQLRGRVGRAEHSSYCFLVTESTNSLAKQRLGFLVDSNDGFEIAEMDMQLRGPGQVLGTRQSGLPDLALASLVDDGGILEQARQEAKILLSLDPQLEENLALKTLLDAHLAEVIGNANLN